MLDVDELFDPADGLTVDAVVDGGLPFPVYFEAAYTDALGVQSAQPAITARSTDVCTARQTSVVEVNGTQYRVVTIEPDGRGLTVMRLHRA